MAGRYPNELPQDPVLRDAAMALEDGRLAGEVLDPEWMLVYVSTELRNLVGCHDEEKLLYGRAGLARNSLAPEIWSLNTESRDRWWGFESRFMRHDVTDDPEWIEEHLGPRASDFLEVEAAVPPSAWAGSFETLLFDELPASMGRVLVRLKHDDGRLAGILGIYVGGGLRGSVQAMLSRGSDEMFERMAALTDPIRRPVGILFADLEASGVLSRKLPSSAYFELIREMTTVIDRAVIDAGGIVGKHVGDGVSAFFLAEQCGGEGPAAAACLSAAGEIRRGVRAIGPDRGPLPVNLGAHWGETVVIGQVVTGGRLEVTALGDEVNEAARIQEVARGGAALASKNLIERIPADLAARLGVDPGRMGYEIVAEIEHAGEKVKRDAGGLAVCEIPIP